MIYKTKSTNNILILLYILLIIILAILIYRLLYKFNLNNYDAFESPQTTKQSFERTKLYGSIFLDNLNEVITKMTDPPILYDTKQINLIRYSDVIL